MAVYLNSFGTHNFFFSFFFFNLNDLQRSYVKSELDTPIGSNEMMFIVFHVLYFLYRDQGIVK